MLSYSTVKFTPPTFSYTKIDYVVVFNTILLIAVGYIVKVLIHQQELKKYGCDMKALNSHFTVSIRKTLAKVIRLIPISIIKLITICIFYINKLYHHQRATCQLFYG